MKATPMKVVRLHPDAQIPRYAHVDDSGMDLVAIAPQTIPPHQSALIPIGISIEIPMGTEAQVRPRSGLALNHAVTVLNTPGTVDAGYRGEIKVILINHGQAPFQVEQGMKVAQMVIMPILRADIEVVSGLSASARGEGGFGSTGLSGT
ncbi:MAG: dUTP diphosphatase [Cyanobacteria bacterium P01_D01_bin.105]